MDYIILIDFCQIKMLTFIFYFGIITSGKEICNVMIDRWIGISYYQFPSFTNNFERSLYEEWHDYLDTNEYHVEDDDEVGEEKCWD